MIRNEKQSTRLARVLNHTARRTMIVIVFLAVSLTGSLHAQTDPGDYGELLLGIQQSVGAGEIDAAVERLEQAQKRAVEAGETFPSLLVAALGGLYLEQGKAAKAYEVLAPLTETSRDPALFYNAGRAALAIGRPEEGFELFHRSVDLLPVSPAARSLGMMEAQRGNIVEGYRLLRPWALQNPDDEAARVAAAYLALDLGRTAEAEQLLSDLPQDEPRIRLLWGKLLLQQDDPRASIATVSPLKQVGFEQGTIPPELDLDMRKVLAEGYLEIDDPARAIDQLEEVEVLDISGALLLAQAQIQSGEHAAAVEVLEPYAEALFEKPADEIPAEETGRLRDLAFEYGRASLATGDAAQAVKAFRYAIELEPWRPLTAQLLSQALSESGAEEKATEAAALAERLQQTKERRQQLFNLGQAGGDATGRALLDAQRWLFHAEPARALEIARREIALSPSDLRPRFLEVQALIQLAELDEAEEAADRTLEIAPDNADALYQKGLVLMLKQDLETAEDFMRRAIDASPEHTAAMNDLALILLSRGELDATRELLERILILQPNDPKALATLENLEQRQ